ncbi:MAG: NHLP leader peptide family natural product precursor [Bacteroidia bacterium]|nr:NHLP leader peptide family natural product precursor [Bacteroidia bacterium]
MTQRELLEKVGNLDKLTKDISFRNAFMANPKTMLEKEFSGLKLNDGVNIFLHENTAREMHVILVPNEELVFNDSLEDAVETVLDKAISNDSFKKLLMADPKGTLANELPDFYVPADYKIYFHENTPKEIHLLIPSLAAEENELSEAELDAVAGGSKGSGPHVGRKRGGKAPKCRSQKFRR